MYVYGHDLFLLTLCCKAYVVDPCLLLADPLLSSEFLGLQNVMYILDSGTRYTWIDREELQLISSATYAAAFSSEIFKLSNNEKMAKKFCSKHRYSFYTTFF